MSALGVIFDWDGVIIDSARPHEASWERLATEEKRTLPDAHFKRSFGMKNEKIIPDLFGWTRDPAEIRRLSLRKEELYREIVRAEGITALPGVAAFLQRLRAAEIPCAIGSSTHRLNIDTVIAALGFQDYFQAAVTAEDVQHGKPHPEVFLLAARRIGREPRSCVVFEDAPVGVQAARAGGMKVVGVATTHPPEALAAADRIVRRLDELGVADLRALMAA